MDVELVHESASTRQAEAQPARRGVPVLERAVDIGDPGPLIARNHDQAHLITTVGHREVDFASLRVHQDVAGDLRDGGRNDGLIAVRKTGLSRQLPPLLPDADDVHIRRDREEGFAMHVRTAPS